MSSLIATFGFLRFTFAMYYSLNTFEFPAEPAEETEGSLRLEGGKEGLWRRRKDGGLR